MNEKKILIDDTYFSSEYLPEKLTYRETEFSQLANNVRNGINTLVIGPVGSAKTTLVKLCANEIKKEIELVYMDCNIYDTQYAVLREILPSSKLIVYKSVYELVKLLADTLRKRRLVICFDNFSRMKESEIIRKILGLGMKVILVGTIEREAAELNENLISAFPSLINLKPYSLEQSFAILENRVLHGLAEGSCSDKLILQIADKVKGNISRALGIIRFLALQAQIARKQSLDELENKAFLGNPLNLGIDESTLLRVLEQKRKSSSHELFNSYKTQAILPKGERSFRKYMQKLCSLGLARPYGTNSSRSYEIITPPRTAIL